MDDDLNLSPIELAVLSLTVFVVFSLLTQELIPVNPEMERLLGWMDNVCCMVFLGEWVYRLLHAPHKRKFIVRNMIDLAASFPVGVAAGPESVTVGTHHAAYKNSRQHKPVCDLLPQQRDTDSPLLFFHRICYADDGRACTDSLF